MQRTPILGRSISDLVVCPKDHTRLEQKSDFLVCEEKHSYRAIDGIPILLLPEAPQTHVEGQRALAAAEAGGVEVPFPLKAGAGEIDYFVNHTIGATNGSPYQHLVGRLTEYPIPALHLPPGDNRLFLEIGCNWGRWCIAAARAGYRPVGIDPSLRGIHAARRVAEQLGVQADYLVADARHLPFRDSCFDQVFSYSVLQHISKDYVLLILAEIHRVLQPAGKSLVQMPNALGVRCLYHQVRRGFRQPRDFEVRYWTPWELDLIFRKAVGPTRIFTDGYFSLNPQMNDVQLLPAKYRALVRASEWLRKTSEWLRPLTYAADSLYVESAREPALLAATAT